MQRSPSSTPFGVSPISAKVADTPWDIHGADVQTPPRIEYPAMPIDLAPSLGQAPMVSPLDDLFSEPESTPPLRALGSLVDPEAFWKRSIYLLIALALAGAYFVVLFSYWAPAPGRPGIDENGYLVGGRNFALHGTTGFKPTDNYQFVGAMWVRTKDEVREPGIWMPAFLKRKLTVHTEAGWYYPKYPVGTSMLDALAIWIGGPSHGREGAFLVSPVCATLAVLGMFLLTRAVAGSFFGLLAMIVLATGQTMLDLAIDPNSHAPSLCMVVWGMFLLLRWWQTGAWWRGVAAGLLLGFAVTIRYTEALLLFPLYPLDQILKDTNLSKDHPHWWQVIKFVRLLPIGPLGLAVLFSIRWTRVRSYFMAAIPIVSWGAVVGGLVAFNWFAMGQVTGYDQTNESLGFSTAEFLKKWDFSVHELYLYGSFLILPLGLMGMALLFRRSARAGLMVTLWFLPGALLYNAYYWGQQAPGVGFLRFFLTLFPPLIVGTMWLLNTASLGASVVDDRAPRRGGWLALPIGTGILMAAGVVIALFIALKGNAQIGQGSIALPRGAAMLVASAGILMLAVIGVGVWMTIQEMGRGRGSFALPIGAGILVAASATVGVWISTGDMERQHRGNMNLSISGHHVFDKMQAQPSAKENTAPTPLLAATMKRPVAPVIFADEGMFPQFLQYLQFMTDADCYALDAFDVRLAGGFGIFGMGQKSETKQDAPVLLQRERIEFMSEFFKKKTAADLVTEQHKVMDAALASGRQVYAIVTPVQLIGFKRRFISEEYEMSELDHWAEPFAIRFADEDRPERGPGAQSRTSVLAPRGWNGSPLIHWQPQELSLMQIQRKAAATQPATQPTTPPTSRPAVAEGVGN